MNEQTGNVTQHQRQSVIQPSSRAGGGGGGGHSSDTHCAKCNNSLYGTEFVTAGGKNYHQEHFVCAVCTWARGDDRRGEDGRRQEEKVQV